VFVNLNSFCKCVENNKNLNVIERVILATLFLAGVNFCKKISEVYFHEFILQQQKKNTPSERRMFSIWFSFSVRAALVRSLGAINKRFCWTAAVNAMHYVPLVISSPFEEMPCGTESSAA
jgi:hypothetical protein